MRFVNADGRAALLVDDPEALALEGDWTWTVASKASAQLPFAVYVSAFLDAAPPEGYTAVPAA